MGDGYNACRDAYFTCMDQFCANKDSTYHRCICSGRLNDIRDQQRKLAAVAGQLQDFSDINIDAISKSANEVSSMQNATVGEKTAAKTVDTSASANALSGIQSVLNKAKNNALSTAGTLDIAGDINAIWMSSDLIGSTNVANLEGAQLYAAVNEQCKDLSADACPRMATMNMVVAAYGMYIEQDCNTLATALSGQQNKATTAVAQSGKEMALARLQNYDVHNSDAINACVGNVRTALTADSACGANFVHCLDVTGMYLNIMTGEPIYSPNFFNLGNQISLDGDTLTNNANVRYVSMLEKKKNFAKPALDKCTDIATDVWAEFKRQALVEIYQGQQQRITDVKNNCVSVVNKCYDTQTSNLKDFSNMDPQALMGQTVTVAEAMCQSKLAACSNLYGGGAEGMAALTDFVFNVGSLKIADNCQQYLTKYIQNYCTRTSDISHEFPYDCRARVPGDIQCADATPRDECTNSVYLQIANYARENCTRPGVATGVALPAAVLAAVNMVMDNLKLEMAKQLQIECQNYGGAWKTNPTADDKANASGQQINAFNTAVGANVGWGVCVTPVCDITQTYKMDGNRCVDIDCSGTPNATSNNTCAGFKNPTAECAALNCKCPTGYAPDNGTAGRMSTPSAGCSVNTANQTDDNRNSFKYSAANNTGNKCFFQCATGFILKDVHDGDAVPTGAAFNCYFQTNGLCCVCDVDPNATPTNNTR